MIYTYACDVVYDCPIANVAELMEATNCLYMKVLTADTGGMTGYCQAMFFFSNEEDMSAFINLYENAS